MYKKNYLNFLLALIPLSFIAGNLIININVLLIILFSIILYKSNVFKLEYFFLDKIIFIFFFFILFTGFYNDYYIYVNQNDYSVWSGYIHTIKKSIFFSRFLLFYIILRFLIEKDKINLYLFFASCSFASLFVCFDIFYQFINGKDLFGFGIIENTRKLSGPFGDELIAGGFIQRFSLFTFFFLPLFHSSVFKKNFKYLVLLMFVIFLSGIVLSGNRMPLLIFIFSIFLLIIFTDQIRKYFLQFMLVFALIFSLFFYFNSNFKSNVQNFSKQLSTMTGLILEKNFNINNSLNKFEGHDSYINDFSTFYETWKLNRLIGGGIKNYRYYCHLRSNKKLIYVNKKMVCNMHPHNYYLEIMTDTGLLGLIIISSIFINILYITLIKKYFTISSLANNHIITPFIFLFLSEIFPIKSTGSFFTTSNATYIFLIMSILIALARKENFIEKKG